MAIKKDFTHEQLSTYWTVKEYALKEDALYHLVKDVCMLDDDLIDMDFVDGTPAEQFVDGILNSLVQEFNKQQSADMSEDLTWEDILSDWIDYHEDEYKRIVKLIYKKLDADPWFLDED